MKKLLTILLVSPVLILAILVIFILTIDPTRLAPVLQEQLAKQGIDAQFKGKIAWRFYPIFGLQIEDIELRSLNPAQNGQLPELATVDQVAFAVEVKPLFERRIEVKGIAVNGSQIHLYVDDQGLNNWSLAEAKQDHAPEPKGNASEEKLPELKIEEFKISDLRLTYEDKTTQTLLQVENFNLSTQSFNLEGSAFPTTLSFTANSSGLKIHSELKTSIRFSLESLASSLNDIDASFVINNSTPIQLKGQLAYLSTEPKTDYYANLHIPSLDVDNLLNALPASSENSEENTSDTPLPLETLNSIATILKLKIDNLKVMDLNLSKLQVNVENQKNMLEIHQLDAEGFNGSIKSRGQLSNNGQSAQFTLNGEANNIDVGKLAKDFADNSNIAGATNTRFSVQSTGATTNSLINSLAVQSNTKAQSLVIQPLNIEKQYCRIVSLLDKDGPAKQLLTQGDWPSLTALEPVEIIASYQDGRVTMSQLQATITSLAVSASGEFDLASGKFDFPIALSLQKLGLGENSCLNISEKWLKKALPLRCKGKLDAIGVDTCLPDTNLIGDILKQKLKAQADAKLDEEKARLREKAEAEKMRAKEKVEAEKKRAQEKAEAEKQEAKQRAKDKLENKLKNLLDKD